MKNSEIKEVLLWQFKYSFSIEKKTDIYNPESESFEHQCGFEYQDNEGNWHDAYMNIHGNIFKTVGDVHYHCAYAELGSYEPQGGEIQIADWHFGECEVYVDSAKAPFTITLNELSNITDPKDA